MKRITNLLMLSLLAVFLCTSVIVFATAGNLWATPIWGTDASGELNGYRTSSNATSTSAFNGGVTGTNDWADWGFGITWEIRKTGDGLWQYDYSLKGDEKGISHFILEVTEVDPFNIYDGSSDKIEDPKTWEKKDGTNPNMPNPIYGVKFDFGGNPVRYTLITDRAPVYGVFYAKSGNGTEAWSNALGYEDYREIDGLSTVDFIVRPDGAGAPVPEPATMMLFGSGLIGLAGVGRRRFLKRA